MKKEPRPLPVETFFLFRRRRRRRRRTATAEKRGLYSKWFPHDWSGIAGKIADAFNDADTTGSNERMAKLTSRISRVVGKEGKIHQRASIGDVSGAWNIPLAF